MILHDWDDKHCLKVLKDCHTALPSDGLEKLIIVEMLMLEETPVLTGSSTPMDIFSSCSCPAQMAGSNPRPSMNTWRSVPGSQLSKKWANWENFVSWNPLNDSSNIIKKLETQHWRSIFPTKLHFLGRNTNTPAQIPCEFIVNYVVNHVNYLHYSKYCIGYLNHFRITIIV